MEIEQIKSAAALRYSIEEGPVPKVVASGSGATAEEIIRIAREHGIPLRENPALMEMLMQVELLDDVPPEAFALVAEVFAFIYEMNNAIRENEMELEKL